MKPTSEILIEISEGLNKLPEGLQRDAAAMNLFKRVGIEAIPFMTELNHNLHIAHEEGFGPTEEDVRRFQEYQREVSVLETKWDALVRKFKEGLVITVSFAGKGVDWFLNNIGTAGDEERALFLFGRRDRLDPSSPVGGYSATGSTGGLANLPMSHQLNPWALINLGSGKGSGSIVPGSGFRPGNILQNLKSTDWGGFSRNDQGSITGMHGVAGAAVFAGGTMLAEQGLMGSGAGTWGGVAEGTAGGAAIGFTMGGPLGAAIGAGVGLGIGLGEKAFGVKSLERTAHDDIKSVYGVDIPTNSGTVKQVVELAKSQFGGSVSVAVRSPSVRQLVMLYSEATGQKMPLSATTPYAGSLVEQGGSLYQQASFQNNAWHMYGSNLPTLGGIPGGVYPTPGGPNTAPGGGVTNIALNINGQPITPEFVTDQSMAAQGSSYGRTQQAANMQVPGLMVA
jgi:hypothetical protein